MGEVMEGVITIVQESRFQMTDDHGVSRLFILGPHAGADADQLLPLRAVRVRLQFDAQCDVIGNVVTGIAAVETA